MLIVFVVEESIRGGSGALRALVRKIEAGKRSLSAEEHSGHLAHTIIGPINYGTVTVLHKCVSLFHIDTFPLIGHHGSSILPHCEDIIVSSSKRYEKIMLKKVSFSNLIVITRNEYLGKIITI